MDHPIHPHWGDIWPAIRQEAHFGNRVVACFADRPRSLYSLLEAAVARHPDGDALVCNAERLSYRELDQRVDRVAAGLHARGVQPRDRIALLLGNRIEFVVLLFAAARIGAISVPISIREQTPGLTYLLGHCAAVMLVHEAQLCAILPAAQDVPSLRHRIVVGEPDATNHDPAHDSGGRDSDTIVQTDTWQMLAMDTEDPPPPVCCVDEEDTAVILYTSGTTGRPKGAMLTHLGIVHSSRHFEVAMSLVPGDCSIASVPLSHVTGLVALITTMIGCSGKLCIMTTFKARAFLELAARERMTHSLMVPAMYNLCLLEPELSDFDLSDWRIGAYGGAPMPLATIESLARLVPSLILMNCYGSTETTSPATVIPPGQTAAHRDTVGVALACAEIRVMDEHGREMPPGASGEIWIKGPMVVSGYWNNPEATRSEFTEGFWHSGDVGSIDEHGYVRVSDRLKDMINRGGYKIFTIEVENALYAHAAVQECAVVARPCPVLGERVHAFVALSPAHAGTSATDLADFVRPLLADYKVPESWTLSAEPLPRNANGKLMKRLMREQVAARPG